VPQEPQRDFAAIKKDLDRVLAKLKAFPEEEERRELLRQLRLLLDEADRLSL
jgi:hypothetical protein